MDLKQKLLNKLKKGELYGISKGTIESGYAFHLKELFTHQYIKTRNEKGETINILEEENDNHIKISLKYDSFNNFKPDYFHHSSSLTDGTLIFIEYTIIDCINSVIGSLPKKLEHQTNNFDSIEYIIGDAFIATEYGNFGTKEKPWLQERITCYIPVKFNYTLKEEINNERT